MLYSPLFTDLPTDASKLPLTSSPSQIDMITNYTLPDSSYVSQLPSIEDTSKSQLALKLLTHKEMERFVSGSLDKDIDIELLKSFTKYSMELSPWEQ